MIKVISMNLEEQIVRIINDKIGQYPHKIFLFGSRANNTNTKQSDIDIGIEASDKIPLHILNDIKAELDDLPVIQKFDVVDFNNVSSEFKNIAKKDIKIIYAD